MSRYIVATRRSLRDLAQTALAAVENQPGIDVVSATDPNMVLIETSDDHAASLAKELADTHIVERELRRGLN